MQYIQRIRKTQSRNQHINRIADRSGLKLRSPAVLVLSNEWATVSEHFTSLTAERNGVESPDGRTSSSSLNDSITTSPLVTRDVYGRPVSSIQQYN